MIVGGSKVAIHRQTAVDAYHGQKICRERPTHIGGFGLAAREFTTEAPSKQSGCG